MGLMPELFEDMTWANFQRLVIYHQKKDANSWDRTRVVMSYILNTQVERKNQKKPKEILPLWTDNLARMMKVNKKIKIPTQEEKEEMLRQIKK